MKALVAGIDSIGPIVTVKYLNLSLETLPLFPGQISACSNHSSVKKISTF